MTRGSMPEYTEAVQGRYLRAAKKEKGRILDEFTKVTACHRKAAIRCSTVKNSPGQIRSMDVPGNMALLQLKH